MSQFDATASLVNIDDNEYIERKTHEDGWLLRSFFKRRGKRLHGLLGTVQAEVEYLSTFSPGPWVQLFLHGVPFIVNLAYVPLYFLDRDVDVDVEGGPCFEEFGTPSPYWLQPRDEFMWLVQTILSYLLFVIWMPIRALTTGIFKEKTLLGVGLAIDIVTLLPFIIASFFSARDWYSPTFLRVWIAYIELRLFVNPQKLRHEVVLFFFVILAGGLTITAIFEWFQNNFPKDPSVPYNVDDPPQYACTSFTDSLYWLVVTFSTVGYGDVTPVNKLTKWMVGLTIILFIVLLPSALSRISSMWERFTNWDTRKYQASDDIPHVVVSGQISLHVAHFVQHFFHPVRRLHHSRRIAKATNAEKPNFTEDVVLQCTQTPAQDLIQDVSTDVRYNKSNLYLQEGNLEYADGRKRSRLSQASAVFILPSNYRAELVPSVGRSNFVTGEMVKSVIIERDYNTLLRAWSALGNCPKDTNVYIVLFHSSNLRLLGDDPPPTATFLGDAHHTPGMQNMYSVCIDSFKQQILGASLQVRGMSTIATTLLLGEDSFILNSPFTNYASPHCDSYQYLESLQHTVHLCQNPTFSKWSLRTLIGTCFVGYNLVLVAVYPGDLDPNEFAKNDRNLDNLIFATEELDRVIGESDTLILIGRASSVAELAEADTTDFKSRRRKTTKTTRRRRKSSSSDQWKDKTTKLEEVRIQVNRYGRQDSALTIESVDSSNSPPIPVIQGVPANDQVGDSDTRFSRLGVSLEREEAELKPISPAHSKSPVLPFRASSDLNDDANDNEETPHLLDVGSNAEKGETGNNSASVGDNSSCVAPQVEQQSSELGNAMLGTLGEKMHIRDHIIVCGVSYLWYDKLLAQLRRCRMSQDSILRPVVFLLESPPSHSAWKRIASFGAVYWMLGRGYEASYLIAAGIDVAYAVLVTDDPYHSSTFGGEGERLSSQDRDSLLTTHVCYRLKRNRGLSHLQLLADFNNMQSIEHFTRFQYSLRGGYGVTSLRDFRCSCGDTQHSGSGCGGSVKVRNFKPTKKEFRRAVKWYHQLWAPLSTPSFIAGECWSVDCVAFLLFRLNAPGGYFVYSFLSRLLQSVYTSCGIRLVSVPASLVGKTFKDSFLEYIVPGDGDAIVLGVWRGPRSAEVESQGSQPRNNTFRGVLLNPSHDLILRKNDLLYIMGSA